MRFSLALAAAYFMPAIAMAVPCFTIVNSRNETVYQATETPIDLSYTISEEMKRKYPLHYLIFWDATYCRSVSIPSIAAASSQRYSGSAITIANVAIEHSGDSSNTNRHSRSEPVSVARGKPSDASSGNEVTVKAYIRNDGSTVKGHTRARPGY